VDADEDRRLLALVPDISQLSVALLRKVVGLHPAEQIAAEALSVADDVLEKYGTDGLRVLIMSLTGWAAVEVEREALATGRSHEALLDEMEVTRLEASPDN
jgi:hypothetical protein